GRAHRGHHARRLGAARAFELSRRRPGPARAPAASSEGLVGLVADSLERRGNVFVGAARLDRRAELGGELLLLWLHLLVELTFGIGVRLLELLTARDRDLVVVGELVDRGRELLAVGAGLREHPDQLGHQLLASGLVLCLGREATSWLVLCGCRW